jgi:calcium-dependent protein kinase
MRVSCGTMSYVAPEVLKKSYSSQCDLWSLGVITFILLAGYMPFSGDEATQSAKILEGNFTLKPERWANVSDGALGFVKSLLKVDPHERLTAETALEHPWIAKRGLADKGMRGMNSTNVNESTAQALRQFGHASKFRRCCMEMMAWSLSNDERAAVRAEFIRMDANHRGTITLQELKTVLQDKLSIEDEEINEIFQALDHNNDEEIHYSDFLAAMVNTRIVMHEDLLKQTFRKFDTDNSGYITVENLRDVLGDSFDGAKVDELLAEGDLLRDGRISYSEFVAYLRGTPLETHTDAVGKIVDNQRERARSNTSFSENTEASHMDQKYKGVKVKQEKSTVAEEKSQPKCCAIL